MSWRKRNNPYREEKNPLVVVLYIAAVAILVAALAYMVYVGRQRRSQQQEAVRQIAAGETEYVIPVWETESESETESGAAASSSAGGTAEEETETETETEADYGITILVLNGTKREGVAAYWQDILEEDGFTDVHTASYTEEIEDHTVLYSTGEVPEDIFEAYFPECEFRRGRVRSGIEEEDGEELPEDIDLYIIIGRNDRHDT